MIELEKVLAVIARTMPSPLHYDNGEVVMQMPDPPHYEIYFVDRVEFWTLDGCKIGESKVEAYP